MEILPFVLKTSLILLVFWCIALLVGEAILIWHAISDWMDDLASPSWLFRPNPVFDVTLRILGVQPSDRISTGMLIVAALMAWPLAILAVLPLAIALRTRAKRRLKRLATTTQTHFLTQPMM